MSREKKRNRMSIWHPGDARGIPKPEPEASGLEGLRGKTSASFTLRRLFVCFLKSLLCDCAWLEGEVGCKDGGGGGGECVHVRATGKSQFWAASRVPVSHPILLICRAVIPTIPSPLCARPLLNHTYLPAHVKLFDFHPRSLHPNLNNLHQLWPPPATSFV